MGTVNTCLRTPFAAVQREVASLAECDAIPDVEPQLRVTSEAEHVMRMEVPASIVTTVQTGEPITAEHIETPPFVLGAEPLPAALGHLPVLERVARLPSRRSLPSALTDQRACLERVPCARSIRAAGLGSRAHLPTGRHTHPRALRHHEPNRIERGRTHG